MYLFFVLMTIALSIGFIFMARRLGKSPVSVRVIIGYFGYWALWMTFIVLAAASTVPVH